MSMIRLIATDMDGTFLDDSGMFNQARFQRILAELTTRQIRFVVASGNQYPHLPPYFEQIDGEITYLAEDGAHIVAGDQVLSEDIIPHDQLVSFLDWLDNEPLFERAWVLLSGRQAAYTEMLPSLKRFKQSSYFYGNLTHVPDMREVTDAIYKVDITWNQFDVSEQEWLINDTFKGQLRATSSGLGGLDVLCPWVDKAYGLKKLQQLWQISPDETMAFGDSGNDLEMLQMAKNGYAMKNASPDLLAKASSVTTASNNESGVMQTIEAYLNSLE